MKNTELFFLKGFESDAVYAIDCEDGAVWLCKTGGLSSQVGLCSETYNKDMFDEPMESQWLVNPVFMHAMRTEHIVQVQVSRSHAIAIAKAGEVFSWGDNPHGQLGFQNENADTIARNRPKNVSAVAQYKAIDVAVGSHHTAAVCDEVTGQDGVVFCWGSNTYGQLGMTTDQTSSLASEPKQTSDKRTPSSINTSDKAVGRSYPFLVYRVEALANIPIRKVACGALHTAAMARDGRLFTWGCTDGGRLGHTHKDEEMELIKRKNYHKVTINSNKSPPRLVRGALEGKFVIDIACGAWHTACIASEFSSDHFGRVFTWGTGIYGQLGAGNRQLVHEPFHCVRLPPMQIEEEEFVTQISCGTHHTACVTLQHQVYTWGSLSHFAPLPQKIQLTTGAPFGQISSIRCGRHFTIFNVLPLTSNAYEQPERSSHWHIQEKKIPLLDLTKIPVFSLKDACKKTPKRLLPLKEQKEWNALKQEHLDQIDQIDLDQLIHPICRLCWHCDGFEPHLLKLWICRHCFHEKELHGKRKGKLEEFEAIRKIQCFYRSKKAQTLLQKIREKHYQKVFSIKHDAFFYFNTWTKKISWERPLKIPMNIDFPIRDPDEIPQILPPFTKEEAIVIIQKIWRGFKARQICLNKLIQKYEKHVDNKGRFFYKNRLTNEFYFDTEVGGSGGTNTIPLLLLLQTGNINTGKKYRYDLGLPEEIKRRQQFLSLTKEDAVKILQKHFRAKQAQFLQKSILYSRYKKYMDPTTGVPYYYNTLTKEVTWQKPLLLAHLTDVELEDFFAGKLRPRQRNPRRRCGRFKINKEPNKAATIIQAMYRGWKGRQLMWTLLTSRFIKRLDVKSGHFYYYDICSKKAFWYEPLLLQKKKINLPVPVVGKIPSSTMNNFTIKKENGGSGSNMTTTTANNISERAKKRREKRKKHGHNATMKKELTIEEAIERIQRFFCFLRLQKKHLELKKLLFEAYEKALDPYSGKFYYQNVKTGAIKWEKPLYFQEEKHTIIKCSTSIKRPRRRTHNIQSKEEAALIVQTLYRQKKAQQKMIDKIHERIEKVYDPMSQFYFYFDKQTFISTWKKPTFLPDKMDLPVVFSNNMHTTDINNNTCSSTNKKKHVVVFQDKTSAAVAIQGLFRIRQARRQAKEEAKNLYEKVWDKEKQMYYYFHIKTGQTQWTKPKILLKDEEVHWIVDPKGKAIMNSLLTHT